ncbi:CGNR zinc finger domain-containing protein [Sulfobacillus thermosulfidooxidans]|uniref:CGNR zinc finger domain-containing protein n=1 Tax=Sulfobacillus thermosulfidooxidans TaxID=28034 RepID=UPI0006B578DE|nr:CGNR zinc finger domain-containing protein [Sulfobacillus thermosulfidooxidans]
MKQPDFTNLGDHLVLNFLNTLQHYRGQEIDLIDSPSHLVQWILYMEQHQWLSASQRERLITQGTWDLTQVQQFRQYGRAFLGGSASRVLFFNYLSGVSQQCPLTFSLVDHGTHVERIAVPNRGGTAGLLSLLSYDFMGLITSDMLSRTKQCESSRCIAYFVNRSGKRKWCSMETCGNRQKSLRHYKRRYTSH